jgi:hypothetical protein
VSWHIGPAWPGRIIASWMLGAFVRPGQREVRARDQLARANEQLEAANRQLARAAENSLRPYHGDLARHYAARPVSSNGTTMLRNDGAYIDGQWRYNGAGSGSYNLDGS